MRFLFSFILFALIITDFSYALEETRLKNFLIEFNSRTEKHLDRLPYAIEKGYEDVASYFILRGESLSPDYKESIPVDLNKVSNPQKITTEKDLYLKNMLITAIRKGYTELALEMLQMGANPSKSIETKIVLRQSFIGSATNERIHIDRKNALYVYLSEGKQDLSLFTALLMKSNPEELNYLGFGGKGRYERITISSSPLSVAIEFRRLQEARILLASGAKINKTDTAIIDDVLVFGSPLFFAVQNHNNEFVMLLLEFGADPLFQPINQQNSNRQLSPLDLALQLGYDDLVELLLAASVKDI